MTDKNKSAVKRFCQFCGNRDHLTEGHNFGPVNPGLISPQYCEYCHGHYVITDVLTHYPDCQRPKPTPASASSVEEVAREMLALFPDDATIEALKADKGYGYRSCPLIRTPKDDEIVRWRAILRQHGYGAQGQGVGPSWTESLTTLRNDGWMVAVHNDYRQNGKPHTFWLLTRVGREGQFVKGEGETDADAIAQIIRQLAPSPESALEEGKDE